MRVEGFNGQIEVDSTYLYIDRKGFTSFQTHGRAGRKQIPLAHIMSIQFKEARGSARLLGAAGAGYIQFGIGGGMESRGGAMAAFSDENSVTFSKKDQPQFEALRDHIQSLLEARSQHMLNPVASAAAPSVADELEKLGGLRDKGLISDEEFAAAKARLLGA